jgi:hypothetical protein
MCLDNFYCKYTPKIDKKQYTHNRDIVDIEHINNHYDNCMFKFLVSDFNFKFIGHNTESLITQYLCKHCSYNIYTNDNYYSNHSDFVKYQLLEHLKLHTPDPTITNMINIIEELVSKVEKLEQDNKELVKKLKKVEEIESTDKIEKLEEKIEKLEFMVKSYESR